MTTFFIHIQLNNVKGGVRMEELGQKLTIIDNFTQPLMDFANKMANSASKMADLGNIGDKLSTTIDSMDNSIHTTGNTWQNFADRLQETQMPIEQINAAKSELSEFAESASLGADKIANAYVTMAEKGVSHASDMVRALEQLASTTNEPERAMEQLTNVVANSSERGTVEWDSFNAILRDTPELANRIARSMNTSTADLIDDLNRGTLSAERLSDALRRAGNGGGGRRPPVNSGGGESSGGSRGFSSVMGGRGFGSGGLFGSMLGANLVASGLMGAFNMARNGIYSLRQEMDESSKAWQTFQGNMEQLHMPQAQIDSTRRALTEYAQATIYDSSDMASTYSQFAAVGTKNAQQVVTGFGGIAAAAQNPVQAMKTLSQQGTQMAAKPMIQWQDFKLMLDQTPAGISAVAKTMHESTGQLIRDVQSGTVKTQDFFDAVAKTGNSAKFTEMATHYKTVGEAIDGTRETLANKLEPEWKNVSDVVINAINRINDGIGNLNIEGIGNRLKPVLQAGIDNTFAFFRTAAGDVRAFFSAFADTGAVTNAGKIITGLGSIVQKIFTGDNSKKKNPFDAFKTMGTIAGEVVNGASKLVQAINRLDPGTIQTLAISVFLLKASTRGLVLTGLAAGLLLLSKVPADKLKAVGYALAFVATALLVFKTVKGALDLFDAASGWFGKFTKSSQGLASAGASISKTAINFLIAGAALLLFGGGILLAGFGMSILVNAIIKLTNAGWPAIAMLVSIVAILVAVAAVVTIFGAGLAVGSVGLILFGAGLLLVAAAIWVIADGMAKLMEQLPNIAKYGLQASVGMLAFSAALVVMAVAMVAASVALVLLGAAMVIAAAGAVVLAVGAVVLAAGLFLLGVALVVVGAGLITVAAGVWALYYAVSTVFNAVTGAVSGSMSKVPGIVKGFLNGAVGVFKGAGSALVGAGQSIINGFISGLQSAWEKGKKFIGSITGWIKDHKGPINYDRRLLVPHGNAVMQGFHEGLLNQFSNVKGSINQMTSDISGTSLKLATSPGDLLADGFDRAKLSLYGLVNGMKDIQGNSTIDVNGKKTVDSTSFSDSTSGYGNALSDTNTNNSNDNSHHINISNGAIQIHHYGNSSEEDDDRLVAKLEDAIMKLQGNELAYD